MFELFVVGTFWFWALLIAWIFIVGAFLSQEVIRGAVATTVIAALLLIFCGSNPFPYIIDHPLMTLMYVGGFFVAGGLWSIVKWGSFCSSKRRRYFTERDAFLDRHNIKANSIPRSHLVEWSQYLNELSHYDCKGICEFRTGGLKASSRKSLITSWIMWWPISLIWTFIDDPIRRICHWVRRRLTKIYNYISTRSARGMAEDFEDDE